MKRSSNRFVVLANGRARRMLPGWLSVAACWLVLLLVCQVSQAAPFRGKVLSFKQPDGATVQVQGWGDEFTAVFETMDGYTVVFDPTVKAYCFAKPGVGGQLVSTGVQIHKGNPVNIGLAQHLRKSDAARIQEVTERRAKWNQGMDIDNRWNALKAQMRAREASGIVAAPPTATTVGTKAGLTLLIDFDDDVATVPQTEIVNFCNGDNYTGFGNNGSIKKYYQDVSNGLLTYTNVVTAYVRIPNSLHPKSYYNDVTKDAGANANLLIQDALTILKALPNYATEILPMFDNLTVDGDNQVVAFNVFYAGENGNVWSMGLWPHSWSLYNVGALELSSGGKKLWRYQISNIGSQLEISTFCHENGHMLCGYPDLYDYQYDSVGGAGLFCLMGAGASGGNPSQICAYLKRASGWTTTIDVNSTSAVAAVLNAGPTSSNQFNRIYRYQKPGVPTEYFLMEARYARWRDSILPASGVAIWHIDELGDRDNQSLDYNTVHANFEVTLVQADNRWDFENNVNYGDSQDLYFQGNLATAYDNEFSDSSLPSSKWWDGTSSGLLCSDFSSMAPTMRFTIGNAVTPNLVYATNLVTGGNGNGMIDFNECNTMSILVTNRGRAPATGVRGILTSTTPGVFIADGQVSYPDILPLTMSSNRTPFRVSTTPDFVCGTKIDFTLVMVCDQEVRTNRFQISTGSSGKAYRYDNNTTMAIPDADTTGIYSGIVISNFNGTLAKVTASMFITHTFDGDLAIQLIGPDGQRVNLSSHNGGSGENYGVACDGVRTTFDDDASLSILSGLAPFAGSYRPEEPLAVFSGMTGDAVNGLWRLHVSDTAGMDVGNLECWSLSLTPIICTDGGGECAGSDLSVTMQAAPIPAGIGSPLNYTMVISNTGPSSAKGAYLSQTLPNNCILGSVTMSQGTYTFDPATSLFSCNLGNVPAAAAVTVIVTVIPTQVELFTSVASVGSLSLDGNPNNNQVSVTVSIENAKSDLSIQITDSPDPVLAGGVLTYTMNVLNLGPSTATNVMVTNTLPVTVDNILASSSQGSILPLAPGNNVVVASLGNLGSNETATITITCTPGKSGVITDTAVVVSDQLDTYLGNNRSTVNTTVGQAADIAAMIVGTPDPVAISNTLTYSVVVTNRGPVAASSLNFTLGLPAGVKLLSSSTSQGSLFTNQASAITGTLGSLPAGGQILISAVIRTPGTPRTLIASASAYALENDPNLDNNLTFTTNSVIIPAVIIASGSSAITSENVRVDGVVEAGETVTAQFELKSVGTLTGTNVTATLLPIGGVTQPSSQQAYGTMAPGAVVAKPFTFTASSQASGSIVASLLVQAGTNVFTNNFTFRMPSTTVFSNNTAIVIPSIGNAAPYPSPINVSGVTGSVAKVTVGLVGFSHTYPHDVNIVVVDPNGRAVTLMSHVSQYGVEIANQNITLDDEAPSALPSQGELVGGSYKPAAFGSLPTFSGLQASVYKTNLITYSGTDPNGLWSLYVVDDSSGDDGAIQGGWTLSITTIVPVSKVADLGLSAVSAPSQLIIGGTVTNWFSITNSGPDAATQVGFTNILAPGLTFVASSLPGTVSGQTFTASWSKLIAGTNLTFSIVAQVTTNAALTDTAVIGAAELDLNTSNNIAAVTTLGLLPTADLGVSISGPTNSVAGVDVTYNIVVANSGPSAAPNVVVTNYLPVGAVLGSVVPSQGSSAPITVVAGGITNAAVRTQLGTIPASATSSISLTFNLPAAGTATNVATVGSAIGDPSAANNKATLVAMVSAPGPVLQIGSPRLISESLQVDGAIESGETIVIEVPIANVGSGSAGSVTAKLLPSSTGVVAATGLGAPTIGESQVYGPIAKSTSVAGRFAVTVNAHAGEPVVLQFSVSDGAVQLPGLTLNLVVSGQWSYTNNAAITIPDRGPASQYPASTNIAGLTGSVQNVTVTLYGLTHSFPKDINVALVGPGGQSVVLMSHAGGAYGITNLTLTFSGASSNTLPLATALTSGTYAPCDCGQSSLFVGFPVALGNNGLEAFNGTDPNGLWSLYIYDDKQGDLGKVAQGWSLSMDVVDHVNAIADLGVTLAGPSQAFSGQNLPIQITVSNPGPSAADNVFLTNAISGGVSIINVTSSQGTFTTNLSGTLVGSLGTIPAGGSVAVEVVVRTPVPANLIATAGVGSDSTDLALANNTAQIMVPVLGAKESRLSATYIKGGTLQLTLTGQPYLSYGIECSTNLLSWTMLSTNALPAVGKTTIFDESQSSAPYRFYRAVRLP